MNDKKNAAHLFSLTSSAIQRWSWDDCPACCVILYYIVILLLYCVSEVMLHLQQILPLEFPNPRLSTRITSNNTQHITNTCLQHLSHPTSPALHPPPSSRLRRCSCCASIANKGRQAGHELRRPQTPLRHEPYVFKPHVLDLGEILGSLFLVAHGCLCRRKRRWNVFSSAQTACTRDRRRHGAERSVSEGFACQ